MRAHFGSDSYWICEVDVRGCGEKWRVAVGMGSGGESDLYEKSGFAWWGKCKGEEKGQDG